MHPEPVAPEPGPDPGDPAPGATETPAAEVRAVEQPPAVKGPRIRRRLVRRGSDVGRAALVTLLLVAGVGLAAVTPEGNRGLSEDVADWFENAPDLLVGLLDIAAVLAVLAVMAVIAVDGVLNRRRALLTAVLAATLTALAAAAAAALVRSSGPVGLQAAFAGDVRTAADSTAAFVAFLTGADLRTRRRWLRPAGIALALALLAGLALGALDPVSAPIAVLFGWSIGLWVRLAVGVPTARPAESRMLDALAKANLPVTRLVRTLDEAGLARYIGELAGGGVVDVTVVDRDRRDTRLLARWWRLVRLRTSAAGHPPLTVRSTVERQALASYLAAASGVRVAEVRALTVAGSDALVFVRDTVAGRRLSSLPAGAVTPEVLADAWRQLRLLHTARLAHRNLTGHNVLVTSDGAVVLVGLTEAEVAASELLLLLDVAQLLASLGLAAGAEPAIAAMRSHYQKVDPVAIAALLQPVALASATRAGLRREPALLSTLREQLLAGSKPAEARPARLERFRPGTVVSIAGATIAALVLLTQISRADPTEAILEAQPAWALVALAGSAVTFLGSAISLEAFTPIRLGLRRTTAVQLAASFLKLVTPAAVGQVALNIRYVQRAGLNATTATATVGLTQVTNFIGTVVLLLVGVVVTGRSFSGPSLLPSGTLLTILVVAAVLIAAVVLLPQTRRLVLRWLVPQLRAALPRLLDVLSQPRRLALGLFGNLLLTGGFVVALDASLRATGVDAGLVEVAVVFLAGSAIGSAAPTPGGLGAVEAALVAGLAAIGVPASAALPAVLVFRTATFWLPVLPGWVAFSMLQRRRVI